MKSEIFIVIMTKGITPTTMANTVNRNINNNC